MQARIISLLLVTGLVLAQLVNAQHAFDLDSHGDDEPCELCLLSAVFKQALDQEHLSFGHQQVHGLAVICYQVLYTPLPTSTFLARAPPPVLLQIHG